MTIRLPGVPYICMLILFGHVLPVRAQRQQLIAPADVSWVHTGISVGAGQVLTIMASGQWSNGGGQPRLVGPAGFQGFRMAGTLLPSANLASLIGKIDSTIFFIGSNYSRASSVAGELFLSMNDLPNTFSDNKGGLRVSIDLTEAPSITPVNPQSGDICRSKEIRAAMQVVEDKEAKDPTGALLGGVACAVTGVCPDMRNMQPTILESRPASDGAGYTSTDPGSFLCQGLFARGDVRLKVRKDGDLASELTKSEMDALLKGFPGFQENFKVRPLQSARYLLILLPSITGVSQKYSTEFSFPQ